MDNETKAIFGSWIQAIGTVLAAIGSTPIQNVRIYKPEDLSLIGNVLQGTGNALIADTIEVDSLNKIGNQIQAIGNSVVVTGIVIDFEERVSDILNIDGNLLQALGGSAALADSFDEERTLEELFNIYGNLLQVIGNSLQALSGIKELQGNPSPNLDVAGSWIQAVGSVIAAIQQTKDS